MLKGTLRAARFICPRRCTFATWELPDDLADLSVEQQGTPIDIELVKIVAPSSLHRHLRELSTVGRDRDRDRDREYRRG